MRVSGTAGASRRTTWATPACRSSTRTRCSWGSCRPSMVGGTVCPCASASARQPVRSGRAPLRRHLLELRGRARPLHPVGAIEQFEGDEEGILAEVARNPANKAALRRGKRRLAARHRPLRPLARARRHVRAVRLHRGGDQHLPQEDRPPRQRRRDRRTPVRQDPARGRQRVPPGRARRRRQALELRRGGRRDLPRRARHGVSSRATSTTQRPTRAKYRDGVYHSGDLGHVLRSSDGRRFLFFDGRTDDWIRKDGENFSAAQVARAAPGARRTWCWRRPMACPCAGFGRAG